MEVVEVLISNGAFMEAQDMVHSDNAIINNYK